MENITEGGQGENIVDNMLSKGQQMRKDLQIKKERLKQKILYEWKETGSAVFWNQCFQVVDYQMIYEIYSNIKMLIKDGYEIKNPAAFFVSTLKKTGYFPWKQEASNG